MHKRKTVISSLFYKFLERCGTQGVQFVVGIILARILSPSDYGTLALISVFIALANVFVQTGLNTALIQNKDTSENDYSTVFYMSFALSLALYIMLIIIAPFVGAFYKMPVLSKMLRVLSLTLLFGAYNSIQDAMLIKNMQFKKLMWRSVSSIILSGCVGIGMAYAGLGVWALVGQQLVYQIAVCIMLSFTVRWRPKLIFERERAKVLFSFGWKLMLSSFIDTFYQNLRSLVIGKKFSSDMLGYYNRAKQFPQLLVSNINGSIQTVMLPTLAEEQDNKVRIKSMMRRAIVTSTFLVFPMLGGLASLGEPLIKILLTEKWLPCVPLMQVLCATMAFYPIHTANLQALNAMGRSDIYLKLEVAKKIVGISILFASVILFDSVMAVALGGFIGTIIESIMNAYPNKKIINYSYHEQLKDILPAIILTIFMLICIYPISLIKMHPILTIIFQSSFGALVYFVGAKKAKLECYNYIINLYKKIVSE